MKIIDKIITYFFLKNDWINTYDYDIQKPTFLYMPWIESHGDKLIGQLNISDQYDIQALNIIKNFDNNKRKKLSNFSRLFPNIYKRMLLEHLKFIHPKIEGFIFTFDWYPTMRILSEACEQLKILRVLVLHESVFIDQKKYYTDTRTNANTPLAEHIICWGDLQKNIFLSRGVDEKKLIVLGAPKFDSYYNFKASISKDDFMETYNFDVNKKIILFAIQPMDQQIDKEYARERQLMAINDLMDFCLAFNYQLILRMPPSRIILLDESTLLRVKQEKNFICDGIDNYLINSEDSIFYSDAIVSINSTMLFEALLLNKVALSIKYIEFEQIWNKMNLPYVENKEALYKRLQQLIQDGFSLDPESWSWAEKNLSVGCFDGASSLRISNYLTCLVKGNTV